MSEQSPAARPAEDPNLAALRLLLPIAEANPNGNNAWIAPVPRSRGELCDATVWQLAHRTQQEAPVNPATNQRFGIVAWSVGELLTRNATDPTVPLPPRQFAFRERGRRLTVPVVCSLFLCNSRDAEDMGAAMELYTDWFATWGMRSLGDETRSLLTNLILSSVATEGNPAGDPQSRITRALAGLDRETEQFKLMRVGAETLGALLRGRLPEPHVHKTVGQLRDEGMPYNKLLAIADRFQEIGLLSDEFWVNHGTRAGGVFTVPGMLERVQAYLQTPAGFASLGKRSVTTVEGDVRTYVNNLFKHYALQTTLRDSTTFNKIITGLADRRGMAGLGVIVALANGVTTVLNAETTLANSKLKPGQQPQELLQTLEPTNPEHLGEALIRIMHRFRRAGLSEEEVTRQATEDAAHVTIIELLRAGLRDRGTRLTMSDLHLRYPEATPEELREMMGELNSTAAQGPARARIDAAYRARRQQPGTTINPYTITRPGYGLLS